MIRMKRKTTWRSVLPAAIVLTLALTLLCAPVAFGATADVSNFPQLKAALEDPQITLIRMTNDIQGGKGGVTINPAKAELVIEGNGHTLTGYSSNQKSETFQLKKPGTLKNITVQNITVRTLNYYGLIAIAETSKMSDINMLFRNINFSGPQLAFAEDCSVTLRDGAFEVTDGHTSGSGKSVDELVEATHIRLEGKIDIVKNIKSVDEIFRMERKGGGITIGSGAVVNVRQNQELERKKTRSGFIHVQRSGGYIVFENDSYFNFVGREFFTQDKDIALLSIGDRAQVYITTRGSFKGCYGFFHVKGNMTVGRDAVVDLIALENEKSDPVIQFDGTSNIKLNSPKQFFVYNSSTKSSNKGLAIGPDGCDKALIEYNNVYSVEYWNMNSRPYNDLGPATYDWRNTDDRTQFSTVCDVKSKEIRSAWTTGYTGTTPFNTKTAELKNINVIRINGGTIVTVTYHPGNEGSGGSVDQARLGSRYVVKTPEAAMVEGGTVYVFTGWSTEMNGGGVHYSSGAEIDLTGNVNLYANWIMVE